MPRVHVVDETPVSAERVLEAARDFSERRAELWPDVHVEHLRVHEMGEDFAEVTEGNPWPIGYVWERLRYDWSQPGSVKGTVIDSNIFRPGSTWEIRATPTGGGSRVEVIGIRRLRGSRAGCSYQCFPLGWLGRRSPDTCDTSCRRSKSSKRVNGPCRPSASPERERAGRTSPRPSSSHGYLPLLPRFGRRGVPEMTVISRTRPAQ